MEDCFEEEGVGGNGRVDVLMCTYGALLWLTGKGGKGMDGGGMYVSLWSFWFLWLLLLLLCCVFIDSRPLGVATTNGCCCCCLVYVVEFVVIVVVH